MERQRSRRGRPPGQPSKKRKAEADLSKNPHTVKARKRMENMDDARRIVENAKNSMNAAFYRARKKMMQTDEYKNATGLLQTAKIESLKREIHGEYFATGNHPDCKAAELENGSTSVDASKLNFVTENEDWEEYDDDDLMVIYCLEKLTRQLRGQESFEDSLEGFVVPEKQAGKGYWEKISQHTLKVMVDHLQEDMFRALELLCFKVRIAHKEPKQCNMLLGQLQKHWEKSYSEPFPHLIKGIITPREAFMWWLVAQNGFRFEKARLRFHTRHLHRTHWWSPKTRRNRDISPVFRDKFWQKWRFSVAAHFPWARFNTPWLRTKKAPVNFVPTVRQMVAEVAGWGLKSLKLPASKLSADLVWQNLPGDAANWDDQALRTINRWTAVFERMKLPVKKLWGLFIGAVTSEHIADEEELKLSALSHIMGTG